MPRKTITTCDLCGEAAEAYPAPFCLNDQNAHVLGAQPHLVLKPYHWLDALGSVCLCTDHFESLLQYCRAWLDDYDDNVPTSDEQIQTWFENAPAYRRPRPFDNAPA